MFPKSEKHIRRTQLGIGKTGNMGSELISCLCFSKDRPMQLEAYIRSLLRFSSTPVKLSILYKAGNEKFEKAYLKLKEMFSEIEFLEEKNFRRQVSRWLKEVQTPFVMFGCDDVLFRESFDVSIIYEAFKNPNLFGFSLRLGSNITYCGMHGAPQCRPRFIQKEPFFLWNWQESEHDWGYPFELDCTVYRKKLVEKLLDLLNSDIVVHPNWPGLPSSSWGHPNRFEAFCSTLAGRIDNFRNMASFTSSKSIVVTVNRVQEECKNFVYGNSDIFSSGKMLDLWNEGLVIDIDAYIGKKYRTIHIGELLLRHRDNPQAEVPPSPEYDIFKVMIIDYTKNMVLLKSPVTKNPRFPDFIKGFDEYFHKPEAETDIPVNIMPCLDEKEQDEKSPQYSWCFGRLAELKPEKPVNIIPPFPRKLPFADKSVNFMISVNALEHGGLGRYGDNFDPEGSRRAFREIGRVIAPGGHFVCGIPIAKEPFILFNTYRVFAREEILRLFPDFETVAEQYFYPEPGPPDKINQLSDFKACIWCFHLKRREP